ncbi:MAG TPA: hypothetical protein VNR40_03725, partial [Steroidobacter sp.]|nr:hypothetical protein [Steroidobacter sp.]
MGQPIQATFLPVDFGNLARSAAKVAPFAFSKEDKRRECVEVDVARARHGIPRQNLHPHSSSSRITL